MGKFSSTDFLDGALNILKTNVTREVATAGQPTTFALAVSGTLAQSPIVPADFTIANGTVSGRKVSVATKGGLAVATAGTADHISLLDVTGSRLLYVTTCPAQALAVGGTCTITGFDIEVQNPT